MKNPTRIGWILFARWSIVLAFATPAAGQFFNDFPEPPHNYWKVDPEDPMTQVIQRLKDGQLVFEGATGKELVGKLLDALEISPASQVMVFSKTSLQRRQVGPANPRALYFNEEAYVGWMPGGRIEIASFDPNLGPVFYYQRELDKREGPFFYREEVCIQCHAGSPTNFIPGLLGRSVYTGESGQNLGDVQSFELVGHHVDLRDRWGGWYVTGDHGLRHMGNATASRVDDTLVVDREANSRLTSLEPFFDEEKYVSRGSDVLALLILDHQIGAHQRLTELHYRARQAFHDAGLPEDRETLAGIDDEAVEDLEKSMGKAVDYLLFRHEAPLGDRAFPGDRTLREWFLSRRKASSDGHSLRDLKLDGRLFHNRCSYMIHSPSFEALPRVIRTGIYQRLKRILTAEPMTEGYGYFDAGERERILSILRETIEDFSTLWET